MMTMKVKYFPIFPSLLFLFITFCTEYSIERYQWVDVFQQQPLNQVDILLVVDNSGSMVEEQEKLGRNFLNFISAFNDVEVDYQIAVISSDMEDPDHSGKFLGPIITPETENAEEVFMDAVSVGTTGSGFEKGLQSASTALSEPLISNENAGFLRDSAGLSIVIFSDEDDWSPLTVDEYLFFFFELKGEKSFRDHSLMNISAVVGDLPEGCVSDDAIASPGFRYIDAAQRTGGVIESICNEDFTPIVQDLGFTISGLRREFFLTMIPDPATIKVAIDGDEIDVGWEYREYNNSIYFDEEHIPEPLSTVTITYDVVSTYYGGEE